MTKGAKKYKILYDVARRSPGIPLTDREEYDFHAKDDRQALSETGKFWNRIKKRKEVSYLHFINLFRVVK